MVLGMEGRGSSSKNITNVGVLLWIFSIIYVFYIFTWQKGILFLIGTLILGAILQKILRPILNPHGR
jgi:predicted PurR-regulated permease PerM